jgi:hypothetical protein
VARTPRRLLVVGARGAGRVLLPLELIVNTFVLVYRRVARTGAIWYTPRSFRTYSRAYAIVIEITRL